MGGGGYWGKERGRGVRERGRGHFHPPAINCTATWCFALKGLRTTRYRETTALATPLSLKRSSPPHFQPQVSSLFCLNVSFFQNGF